MWDIFEVPRCFCCQDIVKIVNSTRFWQFLYDSCQILWQLSVYPMTPVKFDSLIIWIRADGRLISHPIAWILLLHVIQYSSDCDQYQFTGFKCTVKALEEISLSHCYAWLPPTTSFLLSFLTLELYIFYEFKLVVVLCLALCFHCTFLSPYVLDIHILWHKWVAAAKKYVFPNQ